LPSYSEGVADIRMGVDLLAAIYRGLMTYSEILRWRGLVSSEMTDRRESAPSEMTGRREMAPSEMTGRREMDSEARIYSERAGQYRTRLEKDWWNDSLGRYYTWYSNEGQFGQGEGETFLLWFDILRDPVRTRRTVEHLASTNWNVENASYLGWLFYREGYWDAARKTILYLADPATKRREYPEVSFGVLQGVVLGLMGVDVVPGTRIVTSLYRGGPKTEATLRDLPILGTSISISHSGATKSSATNQGSKAITWRAEFSGAYTNATVDGKPLRMQQETGDGKSLRMQQETADIRPLRMQQETDRRGNVVTFVDLPLAPGQTLVVSVSPS
jgi:hypothetical protein